MAITSDWVTGYNADITITNPGPTTWPSWSATFTSPLTVSSIWNGLYQSTGSGHQVSNETWNGSVAPGASVTFGITGVGDSRQATPSTCRVNNNNCTVGSTVTIPETPTTTVPSSPTTLPTLPTGATNVPYSPYFEAKQPRLASPELASGLRVVTSHAPRARIPEHKTTAPVSPLRREPSPGL